MNIAVMEHQLSSATIDMLVWFITWDLRFSQQRCWTLSLLCCWVGVSRERGAFIFEGK